MTKQSVTLTAADPVDFVNRILAMGAKGAVIKPRTFPRIKGVPYIVELELDVNRETEVKATPGITPIPVPEKPYTREELDVLDWDALKAVVKTVGITGRDREQLIRKYLDAVAVETSVVEPEIVAEPIVPLDLVKPETSETE